MQESFFVRGCAGKKKLQGEIRVNSAKNAVLKAMAASLLFKDTMVLTDVPHIEDVFRMAELLEALGVSVEQKGKTFYFTPSKAITTTLDTDISEKIRASIVLVAPLLARTGEAHFPHPGGDVIGARPIDLFLEGFEDFGAQVTHQKGIYTVAAKNKKNKKLVGTEIFFRTVTHTGTEALMMAGVLAKGKTVLKNCALEPEIEDLAHFLNACGAKISGAGTPTITIQGTGLLKAEGRKHRVIPDRIEAGSFLILGALCAKKLTIRNCIPEHLEVLIELLRHSGVSIETTKNSITVTGQHDKKHYQAIDIKTHEYPGFATDLQAPMMVYLTQATGKSLVHETIFEGRLNYTDDLVRMGADITLWDVHRARVSGPTSLVGRALGSPDIRAGLAFVIAAAVAKGNSLINNVYHIDRGYERIEERLSAIGLDIERTTRTE